MPTPPTPLPSIPEGGPRWTYPELDTPGLVVDLDVMEVNLGRMARRARDAGVALRPHVKTHKSPWIARRQLDLGAVGITVAKLGEAEVMAAAGIDDILVAYPLVGSRKLARLAELAKRARVTVSLDSIEVAAGLATVGRSLGRPIPVYLEVDTGLHRVGVAAEGDAALRLAGAIRALDGVELAGVMTHGGHVNRSARREDLEASALAQARDLVRTAEALRRAGFPIRHVSTGSTPAARFELTVPGVTEIRPGTYVFNDANCVGLWSAEVKDCAAVVVATVVARPSSDWAVIDAGSKTISPEPRRDDGSYGIVVGRPDLILNHLNEEHGVIRRRPAPERPLRAGADPEATSEAFSGLEIGERVTIVPNHVCPCVNLSNVLYQARGGRLVGEVPVEARGARQ